jgi:hypothetical protein
VIGDEQTREFIDYCNLRGGSQIQDVSFEEWAQFSKSAARTKLREAWLDWGFKIESYHTPKPTMLSEIGKQLADSNFIKATESI